MRCPCKDCEPPKRTLYCHVYGHCEDHDKWQAQQNKGRKARQLEGEITGARLEAIAKQVKKKFKERRK